MTPGSPQERSNGPAQTAVLEALRAGDKTVAQLAAETHWHPRTVRNCLKALVGKGFVTRTHYEPAGPPPYVFSLVEELYEQAYGDPYDELKGKLTSRESQVG